MLIKPFVWLQPRSPLKGISEQEIIRSERWVSYLDANLRQYIHFGKSPKNPSKHPEQNYSIDIDNWVGLATGTGETGTDPSEQETCTCALSCMIQTAQEPEQTQPTLA